MLLWIPNYHGISNITAELSAVVAIIYNRHNTLSKRWLMILYNTRFVPILTYFCLIWGKALKCHRQPIAIYQKRTLKTIVHLEWHNSSNFMFKQSKALQISDQFSLHGSTFTYNHVKGLLPSRFNDLVTWKEDMVFRTTSYKGDFQTLNLPKIHQFEYCQAWAKDME